MTTNAMRGVSCQNDACSLQGRLGHGNIVAHGYSKLKRSRRRRSDARDSPRHNGGVPAIARCGRGGGRGARARVAADVSDQRLYFLYLMPGGGGSRSRGLSRYLVKETCSLRRPFPSNSGIKGFPSGPQTVY